MKVRRVVTGHNESGRSVVARDEQVDVIEMGRGARSFLVWAREDTAKFPDDGSQPSTTSIFPPVGGCGIAVLSIAPGATKDLDDFVVQGMSQWADPERPGMHRTATMDFDIVLAGELTLELDDGVEVTLGPGDVVVQNGTSHRWVNRGSTDAVFAAVLVGAEHELVRSD